MSARPVSAILLWPILPWFLWSQPRPTQPHHLPGGAGPTGTAGRKGRARGPLTVHLCGFSPVCRRMCTTSMYCALKGFCSRVQACQRHTNSFFSPWMCSLLMCCGNKPAEGMSWHWLPLSKELLCATCLGCGFQLALRASPLTPGWAPGSGLWGTGHYDDTHHLCVPRAVAPMMSEQWATKDFCHRDRASCPGQMLWILVTCFDYLTKGCSPHWHRGITASKLRVC